MTMPQREWLSGCCGFGPDRQRYFHQLPLVEVQQTFFNPPRGATLARWRSAAPAGFMFTLRAWQLITHEPPPAGYPRLPKDRQVSLTDCGLFRPTEAVSRAFEQTARAADVLDAPAIVFETPPAFTPTTTHRRHMARFFESIDRSGRMMVWDPQGVWSTDEVRAICKDLELLACFDPIRDSAPGGPRTYLRLRGRLTDDDLSNIMSTVANCEMALCLFNSVNMYRDAQRLLSLFRAASG